jgi:hypothetical protein
MDFHRMTPNQPQAQRSPSAPEMIAPQQKMPMQKSGWDKTKRDFLSLGDRIGTNALLFILTLLVATVVWLIYNSKAPAPQHRYVDSSKLQAVFLNTGQVYFGNVKSLNNSYFVLTNIYYLQSSNSNGSNNNSNSNNNNTSNQNLSLVKLGCELHAPYDQMVINASEVTFWENLQPDGQVAKAIDQYKQQNPNGQKCSNQNSTSSSTNLQNQGNTNTTSNNK